MQLLNSPLGAVCKGDLFCKAPSWPGFCMGPKSLGTVGLLTGKPNLEVNTLAFLRGWGSLSCFTVGSLLDPPWDSSSISPGNEESQLDFLAPLLCKAIFYEIPFA